MSKTKIKKQKPYAVIKLSGKEIKKLAKWWKAHKKECKAFNSDAGKFTQVEVRHLPGGGIGTNSEACCECGAKCDITDVDIW